MSTHRLLICLFASLVLGRYAHATCAQELQITGASKDAVGIFAEDGKFLREVGKTQIAEKKAVLDCNEKLGLVKVRLVDNTEVWVDRMDVAIKQAVAGGEDGKPVCVNSPYSRPDDTTTPVSPGIGSSAKDKKC